mgnify:CR=1 FL=1
MKKIIRRSWFFGGLVGYLLAALWVLWGVSPLSLAVSPEEMAFSLGEPWVFIYTHFHAHLILVAMVPFGGASLLLLIGTYIVARNGGRL